MAKLRDESVSRPRVPPAAVSCFLSTPHLHPTAPPPGIAVDAAGYPASLDRHYLRHPPNLAVHVKTGQQKIHTLFVSGLPDDVKPREIHNLFRRRPGFESCQLKYTGRGDQVVAFVTFFNHQTAMAAMTTLNGEIFDPQSGTRLHIELARSNSRTKHANGGGAYTVTDRRVRVLNGDHETSSNDGDSGSDELLATNSDNSGNRGASIVNVRPDHSSPAWILERLEEHSTGEILPCSTLFVANLDSTCTEEELKQFFSQYSGFQTLKMRGRGSMPVAFADFTDVESSTKAMEQLKGTPLASSVHGGMHLEYARSKMRKG
ncbi:unnamed protein product [Spirodela intermedia]|uniref:RRM domain-containing protein n=1 Tax=Spirodela intermedia TaxID=51605 RepID=A0A7I8J9G3_SPIIN|nr:unnamed protein product [Spirodela intermedia]CAA6666083.1 unnamed protein product [Spirodela intermedia]